MSDCNPPCDIFWTKLGNAFANVHNDSACPGCNLVETNREKDILQSLNNTLRVGKIGRNHINEYICTATREGAIQAGRVSVVVLAKKGNRTWCVSVEAAVGLY